MKKEIDFKDRQKVEVPFEHLHPGLQQQIAGPKAHPRDISLKKMRSDRTYNELISTIHVGVGTKFLLGPSSQGQLIGGLLQLVALPHIVGRPLIVKAIQMKHEIITRSIKQNGILHPDLPDETRQEYGNLAKPITLAKTHPIFYVKGNGNIVFLKNSRTEYYRYLAQQRLPGKIGIHPWRWRAYLQPPEAPESVKIWAKAKVAKLAEKLAPTPLPAPTRVKLK